MAIKFHKVKAGDVLYDVHSYRMGNTTLRSMGVWEVHVISVDDNGTAMVSWNGNRPEKWYAHRIEKLRAKKPEMETGLYGQQRLKRREKKTAASEA